MNFCFKYRWNCIFLLLFFSIPLASRAQNSKIHYINIVSGNPVDYHFVVQEDFDQVVVLPNAFTVRARVRNVNYVVSARVEPPVAGQMFPTGLLALRLSSTNSSQSTSNILPLTEADQTLFVHQTPGNRDYSYTYEYQVGPIGWDLPAGEYGSRVIITFSIE